MDISIAAFPPSTRVERSRTLPIVVLFTDVPSTLAALREAAHLADGLNPSIEIMVPVVVPYPLQLDRPAVDPHHTVARIKTAAAGVDIPTQITIVYCRDRIDALRKSLKHDSLLVAGWKKRPLFDRTARMIRQLRSEGFLTVCVNGNKRSQ